ncbi:hypothetical protein E1H99_07425 [Enterococcus hirae]|nr:hypothetical protein E1H99_07425 [Enterococcus hirae]
MPKKSKMPQATYRRTSGLYYNQMNDKKKSRDDQKILNNIVGRAGQTLTSKGITHPFGWYYTWLNLWAVVPPLDFPDQQMVVKKIPPAFEVNTRIDVRREGNQTRIHSFVSTSTINRERIQFPLFLNTTHKRSHLSSLGIQLIASPIFGNQTSTSTQSAIDIAKRSHELSIFVHQKVHDLYQLENCSTTRRTDQVNTYIVAGESVEQTSFTTVCQEVYGRAEAQNNQGMNQESESVPLSTNPMTSRTAQGLPYFSADEAAQKLSKAFQDSFENKHNATIDTPKNLHNQVTGTFWNDLTKLFLQFFYQHENMTFNQEQEGLSRETVLSHFVDWLLRTFSMNYGEKSPITSEPEKNLSYQVRSQSFNSPIQTKKKKKKYKNQERQQSKAELEVTPEVVLETTAEFVRATASSLDTEAIGFLTQLWQLAEKLGETVDQFIQNVVWPYVGTMAMPIPIPELPIPESYGKLSVDTISKSNSIVLAFLNNQTIPVLPSEPLIPHWYDFDVFKKRKKTPKVNKAMVRFLCKHQVPCENLSDLAIFLATKDWINNGETEKKVAKRRTQVENIILRYSKLNEQDVTDGNGRMIILQWRNNNAFKSYTFVEIDKSTLSETNKYNEPDSQGNETSNAFSDTAWEQINEINEDIIDNRRPKTRYQEPLPVFYFERELFQKRNETSEVNEKLNQHFIDEGFTNMTLTDGVELITVFEKSLEKKEKGDDQFKQEQFLAYLLLNAYEVAKERLENFLSVTNFQRIFMQWKANTLLEGYTYRESNEFDQMQDQLQDQMQDQLEEEMTDTLPEVSKVGRPIPELPLTESYGKLPVDIISKSNSIVLGFLNNQTIPVLPSEPLIPHWYNFDVFKQRGKTPKVNKAMVEFLCKHQVPCENLSDLAIFLAINDWIKHEGTEEVSKRRTQVARIILQYSGLDEQDVTDSNGELIILQWRNNNAFKNFVFVEIDKATLSEMNNYNETVSQENETSNTFSDTAWEQVNKINEDIIDIRRPKTRYQEPLPVFYFDHDLFQKRNETNEVNEKLNQHFIEEGFTNTTLTDDVELIKIFEKSIEKREKGDDQFKQERFLAYVLLNAYEVTKERLGNFLSVTNFQRIFMQWKANTLLEGYVYKESSVLEKTETDYEMDQMVELFLRENADDPTKMVKNESIENELKEDLPEINEELIEDQRKKIVDFFAKKGIDVEKADPHQLVQKVAEWSLLEESAQVMLDITKAKQLAKILLGKVEDAILSEEEARLTLARWMINTKKNAMNHLNTINTTESTGTEETEVTNVPLPTTTDSSVLQRTSKSRFKTIQWRDPEVMKQVEAFFQEKNLVSDKPTKEQLLIAIGKFFTQENNKIIFTHDKIHPLAKVILKELKLYGGEGEKISHKDAELTVMKWIFENVLGSSIEAYMVKKLLVVSDLDQFTIGRLRDLFTVKTLEKEGVIQLDSPNISQEQKIFFNKLWETLLSQELPNYFLDSSNLKGDLLISDYGSLMQLTGSKILEEAGYRKEFTQAEIKTMGEFFWKTIMENGVTDLEELRCMIIPALLATAQLEPDLLRNALEKGIYKEVALSTFIGYQQNGYFMIIENYEIFKKLYQIYKDAVLKWRRKAALIKEVIQKCIKPEITPLKFVLEQAYLGGLEPCPAYYKAPNLEEWYTRLTKDVSEAYFSFDQKLIEFAINAIKKKEYEFIFSSDTILYEAFAELKNKIDYMSGPPLIGGLNHLYFSVLNEQNNLVLNLEKTDLFAAVRGNEVRIYALKKIDKEGGYVLYRVDRDPLSYLKFGLFDHKNIWEKGYQMEGKDVRIGSNLFTFSVRMNQSKKLSHGIEIDPLLEILGRKHSDQLYQQLYDLGNDKTVIEKTFDIIKHFLPFYDCVTAISNEDVAEAVPSCVIDAVLLIPVFGQIASLNVKFALGIARSFVRGGIRNVIKNSTKFIPNAFEIKNLLISIARYLDPGFGGIVDGGRLVIKKILKFKNELTLDDKVKPLLKRIGILEKKRALLSQDIVMAKLPDSGLEVPVRRVKEHLYMRVTNLETADVIGDYFMLKEKRLEPYKEPVTFTDSQIELLNRLKVKLDEKQIFFVTTNMNSKGYGEGPVITITTEGEVKKNFITMNNELIPVRILPIKGHGVRFDVCDGENIFPVNYNGMEWYLESATSPFVSNDLENTVTDGMDQFETLKSPNGLSAPDEKGLMWDETGRSYIKINDHYIPLILLDNKKNRYHLVKTDFNDSMTVLNFDTEGGQFRLETDLERGSLDMDLVEQVEILARGKKGPPGKRSINDFQEPEPSTSQGVASQTNEDVQLPAYNALPPSAGKASEWTKFRNALFYKESVERVEDINLRLPPLSAFIPVQPPVVSLNDDLMRKAIFKRLNRYLKNNFQVFVGFQSKNVPPSLKKFVKKAAKGVKRANKYFSEGEKLCETLLKKELLAETKEGQYLTEMFQLHGEPNQEEILREAIKRLALIAGNGDNFLRKSGDLGFENIWIASTDLKPIKDSKEYQSQLKEAIPGGFVVGHDAECRIVILADSFHLNPEIDSSAQLTGAVHETVIHEATHLASKALDLMVFDHPAKGSLCNGKEIMEQIKTYYSDVLESKALIQFVEQLATELDLPTLSKQAVAQALDVDPMLRVNFLLMDAEILMTILRDIVDGRGFDDLARAKRSIETEDLETEFLFLFLSLIHISGYQIIEKNPQLNKTQEQTEQTTDPSMPSMDNVSATTSVWESWESTEPTKVANISEHTKKMQATEPTEMTDTIESEKNPSTTEASETKGATMYTRDSLEAEEGIDTTNSMKVLVVTEMTDTIESEKNPSTTETSETKGATVYTTDSLEPEEGIHTTNSMKVLVVTEMADTIGSEKNPSTTETSETKGATMYTTDSLESEEGIDTTNSMKVLTITEMTDTIGSEKNPSTTETSETKEATMYTTDSLESEEGIDTTNSMKVLAVTEMTETTATRDTVDPIDVTKETSTKSSLNLIASSTERSNSNYSSILVQQEGTKISTTTPNKSILNLIEAATERSNSTNQLISKDQEKSNSQLSK